MEYRPVTEAEIIDVLLGDAEPALEARVRQAVRHDLNAAALYAQWSRVIPAAQRGAEPLKKMNARVRDGVMRRLAEEPLAGAQYFINDVEPLGRRAFWPRWLRLRAVALAAAALLLAGVGGPEAWRWLNPTLSAEIVTGELLATPAAGGQSVALRPGDRLALPLRLQAAPGSQAQLRLADHSRLDLAGGADLVVEGRRQVRQSAGNASYEVAHQWFGKNFTVELPQGAVEDLGTAFEVELHDKRGAVVQVTEGRVKVCPAQGSCVEARMGERALLDAGSATVQATPLWTDLARARQGSPTHLLRQGPSPLPYTPAAPPAGAREITYPSPSGALTLKAWLGPTPAEGRHPAVVYLHAKLGLSEEDWQVTAPFREAGFVVLAPMLRGENGNPGNFELFWGEVDDAVAAGRAAATLPGVDPARVYLAGRGAGGTLALLAAMVSSPYAAVAALDGMADPAELLDRRGLAPFDASNPQERLLRTPLAFPDSLRVPLLLCYGTAANGQTAGARLAREATLLGKDCRVETVEGDLSAAPGPAIGKCLEFFQKTPDETR